MEEAAYRHARIARDRAEHALERLRCAPSLEAAEEAWDHFLHACSKVYTKLRAGVTGNPKSWAWFKLKLDERASDELLAYIHHARNNDHHRFDEVTEREHAAPVVHRAGGTLGTRLIIQPVGDRLRLLPVIDKGIEYPVPRQTRGDRIVDPYAATAGSLMLDYLGAMLGEAESLLR